jgi:hypothetical protein
MTPISMELGGAIFRFASNKPGAFRHLPADYQPFEIPNGQAPADALYAVTGAPDPFPEIGARARPAWENELVRLWRAADGAITIARYDAPRRQWLPAARVRSDFSQGSLYRATPTPTEPDAVPFHHPHDRILLIGRLAHLRGGMAHAAAVNDNGRGVLLVGPSGAGKTTLAKLWRAAGALVLNDERNFLRTFGNAQVTVGASPWHGADNSIHPGRAPLAGILHLKQARRTRLRRLSMLESLTRLLTATFIPVFLENGPDLILRAWSALVENVPAYEFDFTPDARAVACAREGLDVPASPVPGGTSRAPHSAFQPSGNGRRSAARAARHAQRRRRSPRSRPRAPGDCPPPARRRPA